MTCPGCGKPMIVIEIESVEVDHCLACGGVWLDGGELELLLDAAENRDGLMESLTAAVTGREPAIKCPACSKKMDKVKYGVGAKVMLDKCPRHHGLWFDQGELREVLQMGNFPEHNRVYELLNDVFGKS